METLACAIRLNTILPPELQARYQNPDTIRRVLRQARTIAIVGASTDSYKASHMVMSYLQSEGYRCIPVNPNAEMILGERCYPDVASIPDPVDVVDIFRPAQECPAIVEQAIAKGAWMRLVPAAHRELGSGGTRRASRANRDYGSLYQDGTRPLRGQPALGGYEYRTHHRPQDAPLVLSRKVGYTCSETPVALRSLNSQGRVARVRWMDESIEFEALVATYERRIYNLLLRMVNDPEDAADLTQETFYRAFRAFDRFRGDAQPYTWLYRIAVNLANDHLEKRARIRKREVELAALEFTDDGEPTGWDPPDTGLTPEEHLLQQELIEKVRALIQQMPPDYREIILLREYEEMSYEEMAEVLGITLEAVRSRLARARAWLRMRLAPYMQEEEH
jgi:RNA polymerase sigma factor (sigma-70 family)